MLVLLKLNSRPPVLNLTDVLILRRETRYVCQALCQQQILGVLYKKVCRQVQSVVEEAQVEAQIHRGRSFPTSGCRS